jgi:hypothetical protein
MMAGHHDLNAGWIRLEAALTAMTPGQTISIDALVTDSGLTPEIVTTVLNELARIELFTREDEHVFVRRSLWPQTQ